MKKTNPLGATTNFTPAQLDPVLRLAAATLSQAAAEAKSGDAGAAAWLQGDTADVFFTCLGINQDAVLSRAEHWEARARGRIVIRFLEGDL